MSSSSSLKQSDVKRLKEKIESRRRFEIMPQMDGHYKVICVETQKEKNCKTKSFWLQNTTSQWELMSKSGKQFSAPHRFVIISDMDHDEPGDVYLSIVPFKNSSPSSTSSTSSTSSASKSSKSSHSDSTSTSTLSTGTVNGIWVSSDKSLDLTTNLKNESELLLMIPCFIALCKVLECHHLGLNIEKPKINNQLCAMLIQKLCIVPTDIAKDNNGDLEKSQQIALKMLNEQNKAASKHKWKLFTWSPKGVIWTKSTKLKPKSSGTQLLETSATTSKKANSTSSSTSSTSSTLNSIKVGNSVSGRDIPSTKK